MNVPIVPARGPARRRPPDRGAGPGRLPAAGCYDIYDYGRGTNKTKNYDRKSETY